MENNIKESVSVMVLVNSDIEAVWKFWILPGHIVKWNNASDDWHTTYAENDLQPGGKFLSRMEAKDGSQGFDFSGVYDRVEKYELIESVLDDGRKVKTLFTDMGEQTLIEQIFEAETENPVELQRFGWQAILNNFKKYVEKV